MVVVAHPGDEAFGFGGAIASAASMGAYVVVVCATRGFFDHRLVDKPPAPGGKNRDPKLGPILWRNLDTVREDEMRRSVSILGVRVLRMLDYAEDQLSTVNFDDLVSRIVEPIRMHRPEVIVSFGTDGVTGDTDHSVLASAVRLAFERAGEPLSYEDDIEEDQVAWRAAKLYELVVPADQVAALGEPDLLTSYGSPDGTETLTLELGEMAGLKLAAIASHVSQTGSAGPFAGWPPAAREQFLATESYRLARNRIPVPARGSRPSEHDLFEGLP
jgi:LmbE family N-acetylglucosaminyl deacetylase